MSNPQTTPEVLAERERCIAFINDWLTHFGDEDIHGGAITKVQGEEELLERFGTKEEEPTEEELDERARLDAYNFQHGTTL
jgi:hypothetical protein